MASISMVIFDCDGVLIDSEVLSMQVWQHLLAKQNISLETAFFQQHFLGRSFGHVKDMLAEQFQLTVTEQIKADFDEKLKIAFTERLQPVSGVEAVLSNLSVPYALATSSSRTRTSVALAATGLNRYFSEPQIFTAGDVARGKPAPDLFLHVAASAGQAPAHCLVIEDSAPGLQAAVSAGMHWRHFTGGSHLQQTDGKPSETLANWHDFKAQFPELIKD